ncbi:hypothetical protein BRD10_00690 [Halobacteriales archaeon SW_12_71_31]|nr:MAG: hypothetical protein BRD10_00690 [Halobacteriales archaeon SW_12_71_31]
MTSDGDRSGRRPDDGESIDGDTTDPETGRRSPVGKPVVRGDSSVTGRSTEEAVAFDPDDPADRERAADVVQSFATGDPDDSVTMLRGAAAAAALVRGEGSYRAAADRAGVGVPFVRTWARVHDLPRAVRREVAAGRLAPSGAKHVARLEGQARLTVAFAAVDNDLGVREVRSVVGDVTDGVSVESALAAVGVALGEVTVELPPALYRAARRRAVLDDRPLGAVIETLCEPER